MSQATRYYCTVVGCDYETFIPEDPLLHPLFVRAGCEHCGRITRFKAVGGGRPAPDRFR